MLNIEHDYERLVDRYGELDPGQRDESPLADFVYDRVFRTTFDRPGFAVITLAPALSGIGLRKAMEMMVRELSRRNGQDPLAIQWAQRFDQQVTTRFHLDNGPDESYLLLGYEPTQVLSEIAIADYSRAAFDLGISPSEYLHSYNPMFVNNLDRLAPYVTTFDLSDPGGAVLLIVNNSRLPFDTDMHNRLGVLHQATIPEPVVGAQRVINSVQIAPLSIASEKVSLSEWERFLGSDEIQSP